MIALDKSFYTVIWTNSFYTVIWRPPINYFFVTEGHIIPPAVSLDRISSPTTLPECLKARLPVYVLEKHAKSLTSETGHTISANDRSWKWNEIGKEINYTDQEVLLEIHTSMIDICMLSETKKQGKGITRYDIIVVHKKLVHFIEYVGTQI